MSQTIGDHGLTVLALYDSINFQWSLTFGQYVWYLIHMRIPTVTIGDHFCVISKRGSLFSVTRDSTGGSSIIVNKQHMWILRPTASDQVGGTHRCEWVIAHRLTRKSDIFPCKLILSDLSPSPLCRLTVSSSLEPLQRNDWGNVEYENDKKRLQNITNVNKCQVTCHTVRTPFESEKAQ